MVDNYLSLYLHRQHMIKKYYAIFVLVFSAGGVFSWPLWSSLPAVIACGLIGFMQLIKLTENQLIPSDNTISKVCDLRGMFISYFNELEKLWSDSKAGRITEEQVSEEFYRLRKAGAEIEAADNRLHIKDILSLRDKADIQTRNYLTQYHS